MAGLQNLKRRIKSVKSTLKTTSAMQMISSVKMRRAVDATVKSRAFVAAAKDVLARVVALRTVADHPLLTERPIQKSLLLVVTSNRGFAGSYNSDVIRAAIEVYESETEQNRLVDIMTIGKKAQAVFARLEDVNLVAAFNELGDTVVYSDVAPVASAVIDGYIANDYQQVIVVYKRFVSTLRQEVEQSILLPVQPIDPVERGSADASPRSAVYSFEPDPEAVITAVVPYLIRMQLYQVVLEARSSEHAARMVAMKNATDAGSDLVDDLVFTANSMRQEKITAEIAEIAAGAASINQ